jgi:hypothetical protein
MEVLEGELTCFQLAITENIVDHPVHKSLDSGRGRFRQRSAGCFHHIGQHDQPGLLGLRLGTGIPIVVYVDGGEFGSFLILCLLTGFNRFLVKKRNITGSVVLADDVHDVFSQAMLPGEFDPVLHVGDQDETAHRRCQLFVAIESV